MTSVKLAEILPSYGRTCGSAVVRNFLGVFAVVAVISRRPDGRRTPCAPTGNEEGVGHSCLALKEMNVIVATVVLAVAAVVAMVVAGEVVMVPAAVVAELAVSITAVTTNGASRHEWSVCWSLTRRKATSGLQTRTS
jgi:hypothetical protein